MSKFIEFLPEVFEQFGAIAARRMFGGHGIYHRGVMFALVADDTLFLKVDETTKEKFLSKGLPAFQYDKGGKRVKMSYHMAPEEIFDDPRQAAIWAELAYAAARESKRARSPRPTLKRGA